MTVSKPIQYFKLWHDLDSLVCDVQRLMDAYSVEPAILVGHLFGGLEVTRFAELGRGLGGDIE